MKQCGNAEPAPHEREWLRASARLGRRLGRIVVLSGDGMSDESGVPTFRDALRGLWANFRPEQLATENAFRANPDIARDWYVVRRRSVAITPSSIPTRVNWTTRLTSCCRVPRPSRCLNC